MNLEFALAIGSRGIRPVIFLLTLLALASCGKVDDGGRLPSPGDIGSPCTGADCREGLTCFVGVPGGYCTAHCEDGCPGGSTCASMGGLSLCLYACSSRDDCRDGFACFGGVCRLACDARAECPGMESCQDGICVADGVGAPCGHPTDCQPGMVCYLSMPGGYCTFDCSDGSCPTGTTCGTYGGGSYCLDDCGGDDDCRVGYVCSAGVCNLPCGDDAECSGGEVCLVDRCEGAGVGAPCSAGPDCALGLSCFGGVAKGYCTHGCLDSDDCPLGSVCGSMKGDLWCLAVCRSDLDCLDGHLCFDGACAPPCVSDSDCVEGRCDDSSGRCLGGDVEYIDLGEVSPNGTVSFDVDAKVLSFTIMAEGDPSVIYYTSHLSNPAGVNIVGRDWFGPPLRVMPIEEVFTVQVPNTDRPDAQVMPGTWRMQLDTWGRGAPARVKVLLRRTHDGKDRDGSLVINAFIAPGGLGHGVNAASAASSSLVAEVFARFDRFFEQQAGLSTSSIVFHDIPSSYSSISGSLHYKQMFRTYSRPDSLNLFFVRSITIEDVGAVAGVSGGIPGPPRLAGSGNSGAVTEHMGHGRSTGDVISHEAGHFMGLYHIKEMSGENDLISDTPQCASIYNCPEGRKNLMWPMLSGEQDVLTPAQAGVVRAFGGVD